MARCVCFTASGNSRVVPEVYWKIASWSARVFGAKLAGKVVELGEEIGSSR